MSGHLIFSHGRDSGPWGSKISALANIARDEGWLVDSVDYRGEYDPERRVQQLLGSVDSSAPLLLVGSSMGAYVSLCAVEALQPRGLFLMAPAVLMPSYERNDFDLHGRIVDVVHGWRDEVVAPANVWRFAGAHSCRLIMLNDDHRLLQALPDIELCFRDWLRRCHRKAR